VSFASCHSAWYVSAALSHSKTVLTILRPVAALCGGALTAVLGILMAVIVREKTGRGQLVSTDLVRYEVISKGFRANQRLPGQRSPIPGNYASTTATPIIGFDSVRRAWDWPH
jgi:crotonobetainyl-CoA:carnitine CoA-transferase CaiB-like acyl-CoA transferase